MDKLKNEPLVVRAAVMAALGGILHALVLVGVVPLEPEAEQGLLSALDGALGFILVLWARQHVSPARKYEPEHAADEPTAETDAA